MVTAETITVLAKARNLSQSDLARMAGVSRQAVSLWLRASGEINVQFKHLSRLTRALGVGFEELDTPLPCSDPGERESLRAGLLWDRLYPDIEDLAQAALDGEPKAMGRLIEVYGLYRTAAMLGPMVWAEFERAKRFIHPARRAELEGIWRLKKSLAPS